MSIYYENNPAGICEDAPCCGCCGPQGDGRYEPDEPSDVWPDDPDYGREYDFDEGQYDEDEDA